jgi:hypothetical protein
MRVLKLMALDDAKRGVSFPHRQTGIIDVLTFTYGSRDQSNTETDDLHDRTTLRVPVFNSSLDRYERHLDVHGSSSDVQRVPVALALRSDHYAL